MKGRLWCRALPIVIILMPWEMSSGLQVFVLLPGALGEAANDALSSWVIYCHGEGVGSKKPLLGSS